MVRPVVARSGVTRIALRLTPRGGRDAIEGWTTDADGKKHLKIRVSAVAEAGKANNALIELLAAYLGIAKSSVRIVRGETARSKIVELTGDETALTAKLEALGTIA